MNTLGPLLCFAVPEAAAALPRHIRDRVLFTGIGTENARRALQSISLKQRPEMILTSGFAGGLNPQLPLGTVVWEAEKDFPLIDALRNSSGHPGTFHCTNKVAITADDKARLWRETKCDCVEMESGVIRKLAREEGIPAATMRVISDAAEEDLPLDFNRLWTPDLRLSYSKLIFAFLRRPSRIKALFQFRQRLRKASKSLAAALLPLLQSKP